MVDWTNLLIEILSISDFKLQIFRLSNPFLLSTQTDCRYAPYQNVRKSLSVLRNSLEKHELNLSVRISKIDLLGLLARKRKSHKAAKFRQERFELAAIRAILSTKFSGDSDSNCYNFCK